MDSPIYILYISIQDTLSATSLLLQVTAHVQDSFFRKMNPYYGYSQPRRNQIPFVL